jgi:hypothetical protein
VSAWSDAVQFAIKRASREDTGAIAGREGILGLPCSQTSEKGLRCYHAAIAHRNEHNTARRRRNKQELPVGSTGNGEWDRALETTAQAIAA